MKSYIIDILGSYTPITTGEGMGTIDWPYIFGGIVFIIVLWFVLRCFYAIFFKN